MANRIEFFVYLAGVILLGLFYEPLKTSLGRGLWFFLAVVIYLTGLRGIGYALRKLLSKKEP